MNIKVLLSILAIVLAALIATSARMHVQAAPAAWPTPAASINIGDTIPNRVTFMSNRAITETTRSCQAAQRAEFADIQYDIDQAAATNTLTLTLEYSIISGVYEAGPTLVGANGADADDMEQYPVFGSTTCVLATVVNTNPVTITVAGMFK